MPSYVLSALPSEYQSDARKTAEKELADMAATLPNASAHVIAGHAGRTVLDWAEKNQPDCIVIASHRPGMQDLLLGSTATQVVRHADCAVHVIR
jgi:nucleotide-binding universal stress UspA family protein